MPEQSVGAAPPGGGWAVAADVATVVLAVAAVLLAGVCVLLALRFGRLLRVTRVEMKTAYRDEVRPLLDSLTATSRHAQAISGSLRSGVESLEASAAHVSDGARKAWSDLEERVNDLTALLAVIQKECEDLYLDTASALRTFRSVTQLLGAPKAEDPPEDVPVRSDADD